MDELAEIERKIVAANKRGDSAEASRLANEHERLEGERKRWLSFMARAGRGGKGRAIQAVVK